MKKTHGLNNGVQWNIWSKIIITSFDGLVCKWADQILTVVNLYSQYLQLHEKVLISHFTTKASTKKFCLKKKSAKTESKGKMRKFSFQFGLKSIQFKLHDHRVRSVITTKMNVNRLIFLCNVFIAHDQNALSLLPRVSFRIKMVFVFVYTFNVQTYACLLFGCRK